MRVSGKLCLSSKNDDYIVVAGGSSTNLSRYLNMLLLGDVSFKVSYASDKKVVFDLDGKLVKKKCGKSFYLYHIGDYDIDKILWELVGNKLDFEVININKR